MTLEVHGRCDEKFASVREAFENNLKGDVEVGATFAATIDGETVIDLWGGYKDREKTTAWEEDTIVNVYSTTKTMAALVMLMLADRGEIDFYEKVAKYWPEFAQNGKEDIEVRHIMCHSAGLPGTDIKLTEAEIYSQDRMAEVLAAQKPWWEDRTQSGYHALTQGYLEAEIVRRVTGKSLGTFFADEIAKPMDADFYIGVPPEKDRQVSIIIPGSEQSGDGLPKQFGDENSIGFRTFASPKVDTTWPAHEGWRRAEIPAANGHGNARSVAQIHRIIAQGGEVDGKRYLSKQGVDRIFDRQTSGVDLVLPLHFNMGMGFGLASDTIPMGPGGCFWGGAGGSMAIIDTEAHTTMAYVMNQMSATLLGDDRFAPLYGGFAMGQMS
jgi:CubicO group peptidase (beta-lactamase class C family)